MFTNTGVKILKVFFLIYKIKVVMHVGNKCLLMNKIIKACDIGKRCRLFIPLFESIANNIILQFIAMYE